MKRWVVLFMLTLAYGQAYAGVYQCPDGAGNVIYRDIPCSTTPALVPPARAAVSTSPEVMALSRLPAMSTAMCRQIGTLAYDMAVLRNRGVSSTELTEALYNTRTSHTVFTLLNTALRQMYTYKHWSPDDARRTITRACQKS